MAYQLQSLLVLLALLPGVSALVAQAPETIEDLYDPTLKPFYHGVASGDPLPDGFIIWTRVTPEFETSVTVRWAVATDSLMTTIVKEGVVETNAEVDFTVKVDVRELDPGTTYYYQFEALGAESLIGRTHTTPDTLVDALKFAVVSCSNYEWGYFSGYEKISRRHDLDAVIHLGDYFYEYADNDSYSSAAIRDQRTIFPNGETVSLDDYRARFATYRLDANLRHAHQQHPFIVVWDDHESANDAWTGGAENHDPAEDGDWEERKAASLQAYFEWMPIRNDGDRIYRTLSYGPLLDIIMLDTRLEGREEQINDVTEPALYAPTRTMLGADQKQWLKDALSNSTAQWKVIGNQVIFSEFNVGWAGPAVGSTPEELESQFLDIWDGYPAERAELIGHIAQNEINDVIFVTGDFHSTFVFEVTADPMNPEVYTPDTGEGAVAVEFATPSISAANFDENLDALTSAGLELQINQPVAEAGGINFNPHMKFVDLDRHGYFVLTVTPDHAQGDYFYLDDILVPMTSETFGGGLQVASGSSQLAMQAEASPAKDVMPEPAPFFIRPDARGNTIRGWYYTPELGWSWINDDTFPFLWNFDRSDWLEFAKGADQQRFFLDWETGEVLIFDQN